MISEGKRNWLENRRMNIIIDDNKDDIEKLLIEDLGFKKIGHLKDDPAYLHVKFAVGEFFEIEEARNPKVGIDDIGFIKNYIG